MDAWQTMRLHAHALAKALDADVPDVDQVRRHLRGLFGAVSDVSLAYLAERMLKET